MFSELRHKKLQRDITPSMETAQGDLEEGENIILFAYGYFVPKEKSDSLS